MYTGPEQGLGLGTDDAAAAGYHSPPSTFEADVQDLCGWIYKRKPRSFDMDKGGLRRLASRLAAGSGSSAYDRRWLQFRMDRKVPCLAYYKEEPGEYAARFGLPCFAPRA